MSENNEYFIKNDDISEKWKTFKDIIEYLNTKLKY